jgi:arsenate reductase
LLRIAGLLRRLASPMSAGAQLAGGRVYNVLFLCTGNSARSIIAEALLNHHGKGRFRAHSAGSHPKGAVHPLAIEVLHERGLPTAGLRSKSWDEFAGPHAVAMDFIFTVCDKAAGEVCPLWPGRPVTAHWGVDDPASVEGGQLERLRVFKLVARKLDSRVRLLSSLRPEQLDQISLKRRLDDIGQQFRC